MRAFESIALLLCSLVAAVAFAAEPATPVYNNVELQAEAQREVQNDLVNATLYNELTDANPAVLANALNKSVTEALRIAKEFKGVRARSGGNQTYPVYNKANVLQGWRGRAEIRIESRDFESASTLIGRLQSGMKLGAMNFSVSPEARRQAQNELIAEAIDAFKARAEIVKAALSGRNFKLLRLNVASGYAGPQPRFAMARAAPGSDAEVAPPSLEGGVSMITVSVNGAIEITGRTE